MALLNWVTGLIRNTEKERAREWQSYSMLIDTRRRYLSPVERAPTINDVNFATKSNLILVGDVHFEYFEKTKDFRSLVLHYSPEVMLVPHYLNACALYQAIRLGVIEQSAVSVWDDFGRRAREVGADWSRLQILRKAGKRKLWIVKGDISFYAERPRLVQLFSDWNEATRQAGLDPEQYFALPH